MVNPRYMCGNSTPYECCGVISQKSNGRKLKFNEEDNSGSGAYYSALTMPVIPVVKYRWSSYLLPSDG